MAKGSRVSFGDKLKCSKMYCDDVNTLNAIELYTLYKGESYVV